jgi:hypothetical protein
MKRSILAVTAAALCFPALAQLPDMPPVKEGLWKIHTVDTYSNQPAQDETVSLCRSHAYDDSVRAKMKIIQSKCTTSKDTTVGNKRSISTSCDIGGMHTTANSVVTMSDNAYHSETVSTIVVSGKTSTDKSVQDQTYEGACPAGMSPGDRKLADGTIQKQR